MKENDIYRAKINGDDCVFTVRMNSKNDDLYFWAGSILNVTKEEFNPSIQRIFKADVKYLVLATPLEVEIQELSIKYETYMTTFSLKSDLRKAAINKVNSLSLEELKNIVTIDNSDKENFIYTVHL